MDSNNPSQNVLDWVFAKPSHQHTQKQIDTDNILDFSPDVRVRYPKAGSAFLETVNPAIFAPIGTSARTALSQNNQNQSSPFSSLLLFCDTPFVTSETIALCRALRDNSPTSILHLIRNPLEWCHSPDDQTVPFLSTRLYLLDQSRNTTSTTVPTIQAYEPSLPFLQPRGGHGLGQILCSAAVPTYLARNPDFAQAFTTEHGAG